MSTQLECAAVMRSVKHEAHLHISATGTEERVELFSVHVTAVRMQVSTERRLREVLAALGLDVDAPARFEALSDPPLLEENI